jgi:hypothetical protein
VEVNVLRVHQDKAIAVVRIDCLAGEAFWKLGSIGFPERMSVLNALIASLQERNLVRKQWDLVRV